ncbi:YodC family protein [Phaeovulum sp.]|uniref:YodC family protein n=1 Tax=Phaeovulum sp. TaxID=2934796 RepID=UPI0039E4EFB8
MAAIFNPGDIVQLKSGGPAMTISEVERRTAGARYTCQWFKGASKEHGYFEEHTLKPYVAPST